MKIQIRKLTKDAETSNATHNQLQNQQNNACDEVMNLRKANAQANTQAKEAVKKSDDLQHQLSQAGKTVIDLRTQLLHLQTELDKTHTSIKQTELSTSATNRGAMAFKQLEGQVETLQEELAKQAKSGKAEVAKQVKSSMAEKKKLQRQMEAMQHNFNEEEARSTEMVQRQQVLYETMRRKRAECWNLLERAKTAMEETSTDWHW